jgi:CspA family cold shock protein
VQPTGPYASIGEAVLYAHQQQGRAFMKTGTVKWFNDQKGFGFIAPDDQGGDLFVHHTAVRMAGFRSLKEGQRVSYEPTEGPKGKQASNVQVIEG